LAAYYDDTINWAFSSDSKIKVLAHLDEGIAIVQDNGDVTFDVPLTLTNLVAFLQGTKLRYNDGLGTQDIVTFLGSDFVEDMRLSAKSSSQMTQSYLLILRL
jgi:hypothetical protein